MLGTEEPAGSTLDQLRKLGVPYRGFRPMDSLRAGAAMRRSWRSTTTKG